MIKYANFNDAIRNAMIGGVRGVAWHPAPQSGWSIYDLTDGCPDGAKPEAMVVHEGGKLYVLPLSDDANAVIESAIRSQLSKY